MSNITATYSLIGGTRPTGDGFEGGLGTLNGGSLTAYFNSGTVDVDLQISFPAAGGGNGNDYAITATNGNVWIDGTTATFSGWGTATGTAPTYYYGNCASGCSANISGFFAGANASRAGVAYYFDDSGTVGNVAGVAAFTKSSSGPDGIDPNIY